MKVKQPANPAQRIVTSAQPGKVISLRRPLLRRPSAMRLAL